MYVRDCVLLLLEMLNGLHPVYQLLNFRCWLLTVVIALRYSNWGCLMVVPWRALCEILSLEARKVWWQLLYCGLLLIMLAHRRLRSWDLVGFYLCCKIYRVQQPIPWAVRVGRLVSQPVGFIPKINNCCLVFISIPDWFLLCYYDSFEVIWGHYIFF